MVDVQISISVKNNLRQLKRWGQDQIMIDDTYSVYKRPINGNIVGQFQVIQLWMLDENGEWVGDWSANQTASDITNAEMLRIADLQIPDEYSLDAKMNTLMLGGNGRWGCPMRANYPSGSQWRTATNIQQISGVYGGQTIEVLERRTFQNVPWQGQVESSVPMSRIRVFTDSDWGKTHATHPELVHIVTVADNQDNYGERFKGIVYLPLITKTQSCWVFDRWLI